MKRTLQIIINTLQLVNCTLHTAYRIPHTAYRILNTPNRTPNTATSILKTKNCILQTANCLLPTAYCLLLTVFLSFLNFQQASAQIYPIQVNPQLIPPYSLKLSDYQTTSSEKLFVNILLTDTQEIGRRVRLKMRIEGNGYNIQNTDVVAGATPIYLDGGINQRLSNLDLRPYFELNNLLGIAPQQYTQPLPSGRYDFCFEVYDFFSGQLLSRKSCFSVYLILNDPPILNLPFRGDLVTAKNPQNLLFSWTPRHLNATGVQYEFTLKELWDTTIDPQAAFLSSPPLYQTTTYTSTLLYGPADIPLLEGKKYAWQVRAIVSDGISETSVFKNNGYSEIFNFTYQGNCEVPKFVLSEAQNTQTVQITWLYSDHIRYQIQYRKKGYGDDDWFNLYAYNQQGTIHNLEAGTTYEFRVGGECTPEGGFAFSGIQEFTTPTVAETAYYNCGVLPQIKLTNQNPLKNIGVNEVFTAGDFPITVKSITNAGATYSGWGFITVPYLADTKIRVDFKNIKINTDYQLVDGIVETSYDPKWKGIADIDAAIADLTGSNGEVATFDATNIALQGVKVVDGQVVLINVNGTETTIDTKPPVVITDKNGKTFTVNEQGQVTEGQAAVGGAPNKSNTTGVDNAGNVNLISTKDVEVLFEPGNGKYTFDTNPNQDKSLSTNAAHNSTYETIKKADGSNYYVHYKAVSDAPYKEDEVNATATFSNGKTKDNLVFKTQNGNAVVPTWSGNVATFTLTKQFDYAKDAIIATVKPADSTAKYEVAGKIDLWHLTAKKVNVVLVSINDAPIPNDAATKLNEIYNKAGVSFNVSTIKKTITNTWGSTIETGDSDLLNTYTNGQQLVTQAVMTALGSEYKTDTYYMLYTNEKASNSDAGFMPLLRQFGFVFNGANRTLAHELGHGVFGLKHPFTKDVDQRKTNLLMDYGGGELLSHNDWEMMYAPGLQLYQFTQGSSDGAQIADNRNFLMPNHKPFRFKTIDPNIENYNIKNEDTFILATDEDLIKFPNSNGALFSFRNSGKEYKFDADKGDYYLVGSSNEVYNNNYNATVDADKKFLLIIKKNECFTYFVSKKLSKEDYQIPDLDVTDYIGLTKSCADGSEKLCNERLEVIANYMSAADEQTFISYESLALTDKNGETVIDNSNSSNNFKYKKFTGSNNSVIEIRSFYNVVDTNGKKPYLIKTNDKNLIRHGVTSFWIYMGPNDVTASGDLKVEITLEQFDSSATDNTLKLDSKYCLIGNKTLHRGQYVGDIGNFLLTVIATPLVPIAVIEAGTIVSAELLTETLISYCTKEAATSCVTGAAVDLALQYGMNYILKEEGEEIVDISKANLVLSCVTNTFIKDKDIVLGAAIYGFGNNIITQVNKNKSIKDINITDAEIEALTSAIVAMGVKSISRYAIDHKWGTALTQKILNIIERRTIKNYFANSSVKKIIVKATAGTVLFIGSHQAPIFLSAAEKVTVKVEQLATIPATNEVVNKINNYLPNVAKTIANDVEAEIQENFSTVFKGKVSLFENPEAQILSYTKDANDLVLLIKLKGQDVLYKLLGKLDPNQGITIASALASVQSNTNTTNCNACTKQDQATCKKFEQLLAKVGTHDGIAKLCAGLTATNANPVITQLLTWDKAEIILFLDDVNGTSSDKNYISSNITSINSEIVNAWKFIQESRPNYKYRKDWKVLQETKAILSHSNVLKELGQTDGLKTIVENNYTAPCYVCDKNNLKLIMLNDYLNYVDYFASNYTAKEGYEKVLGKQGIKSGGINQVIATAFVLRVLKQNPDYINTISEFEEKIEAIDDDGNENKAFADIVESNSKIIECKSWEINGKAFQNFVLDSETPVGSVKQFTTYLMDATKVTTMNQIEYWFDIKKLNNNPDTTPIKEKFKQMMYNGTELTNKGTQVFNAIWGNGGLRGKLFPKNRNDDEKDDAKNDFLELIKSTKSLFYNFISVK